LKIPTKMTAVVLTGYGGFDKLAIRHDIPVPSPGPGEVLIRVGACGVNNTDINTRLGWYAPTAQEAARGDAPLADDAPGGWSGPLAFPRIQGADVAGHIAAVGRGVPEARIGERVIVEPLLRDPRFPDDLQRSGYLGSERDGGFAAYLTVPADNAFPIVSDLSDAELATFPCSYSTAENMLTRIRVTRQDTLLVTGASGGVGSALVQLAKRRGARVLALTTAPKIEAVAALGADRVIDRETVSPGALKGMLPDGAVDAVADVVGGSGFSALIRMICQADGG
jgi:NADPH:quinone reductase-like Zn-dependent oxidoreductase